MKRFVAGSRMLGSGLGIILRSPKLLLLGALPALISAVLLLALLSILIWFSGDAAELLTPFADGWGELWRRTLRLVLAIALVGGAALLGSLSFIALTLLLGGPFYEHIAERAEQDLGLDTSGDGAGWTRSLGRGIRDSGKLVFVALLGSLVLFVLSFVPVLGQFGVPVLAALFGAWVLAMEMVGLVFQRRGLRLSDRHRALGRHRAVVFGFGLPTYLLCLVPVVQLVVVPAAVVGGTLLAHEVLDGDGRSARESPGGPRSAEHGSPAF